MKHNRFAPLLIAAMAALTFSCTQPQQKTEQTKSEYKTSSGHFDELANLPFFENRPTEETSKTLDDELLFQRATQTYLWALPLINTLGMKYGSEKVFGSGYNILPIWKKRLDAKTLVTTPNSDVIYAMSYVDLGKDGPLVFEVPPMLQGILLDFWQQPIPVDGGKYFGDIGFFGPDAGKGGKFLLLPPGYTGKVPSGYFVYRSATNNVFIFLRAFYKDPKDLNPAVSLVEQSKIYPLKGKADVLPMKFPDASGVPANMLPVRDGSVFDQLKLLVESEGSTLAGSDWLGMLATIGITKGKAFNPDSHTREILDRAAKTAYKMSRVIAFKDNASGVSFQVYPDRKCWLNPFADGTPSNLGGAKNLAWQNVNGDYPYLALDARIWMFSNYYSISPGMVSQSPGMGAKYMISFNDVDGAPLSGGSNYHLNLPANIPAANFWSITLYEAENASGLANGQPFPSLGSKDKPSTNPDGSIDLYLSPKAPEGKQANWLNTIPGKGYFVILRLYGPTEAAINKSWKPGEIEKVK